MCLEQPLCYTRTALRPTLVLAAVLCLSAGVVYTANGDSDGAGNGVYRVFVEDQQQADGAGTFTILTGPDHPAGEGEEILFNQDGPGDAATSYLTVRSYTTGVDYVQALGEQYSGNIVYPLDSLAAVQAVGPGPDGYLTTYQVSEYDALAIESLIEASGAAPSDAAAAQVVTVRNNGLQTIQIGVRLLLDVAPGGDDGPRLVPINSEGSIGVETTLDLTSESGFFNVVPDAGDHAGAFAVSWDGPAQADSLKYASWPDAFDTAFDYTTGGVDISSDSGLNDSALLYYFGGTPESAITLNAGESASMRVTIRAPYYIENCDNRVDDDGDTAVDGADTDCPATPTPSPTPTPGPRATATPAVTPGSLPNTGGKPR